MQQAYAEAIETLHTKTAIYTREGPVRELVEAVSWPLSPGRLLEPSCGDGAFLTVAIRKLLRMKPGVSLAEIADRIEAWEIHRGAAHDAEDAVTATLTSAGYQPDAAHATARQIIHVGDFLRAPVSEDCAAVVGNPPYLRFGNIPEILRAEYAGVVPKHARADLLHSFLDRCAEVLRPQGEVGFVTADRWLFNENAKQLRVILGSRFAVHQLQRLDAGSAFYRPKQRKAGTPPRIHPVAVVLKAPADGCIQLGANAIYPDARPSVTPERTLACVAEVRLAPWLGGKNIFLVDEDTARSLPASWLVPAVDTENIRGGVLGPTTKWAIRTTRDAPPREILSHLDANLDRMAQRGRREPRWLPPESWDTLKLDEPMLVVPRIAKTLRPIRVPPGHLPVNHNVSIVTKGELSLEAIEHILRSRDANDWVQTYAPRLEGGYYSLTTTLLRKLPVFETLLKEGNDASSNLEVSSCL